MNLMRIEYFVTAAKYENFTVAAQELFTTQPNLSRQIGMMEQELGVPLFHRTARTVSLTQAGHYLYGQLKDMPEFFQETFSQTRALGRRHMAQVTIGILDGQPNTPTLSRRLSRFLADCPEAEITLETCSFNLLYHRLESFQYDLIIVRNSTSKKLDEFCTETLYTQQGTLAINRNHPLAKQTEICVADLREEPFVTLSQAESPDIYELLLQQCKKAGFEPNVVREVSNFESLLLCVEAGIGVALMDRGLILSEENNIRTAPLPGVTSEILAVWYEGHHSPAIRQLIPYLKDETVSEMD